MKKVEKKGILLVSSKDKERLFLKVTTLFKVSDPYLFSVVKWDLIVPLVVLGQHPTTLEIYYKINFDKIIDNPSV